MSAILINNTLQAMSPFTDAVINEVPQQSAPLLHDRLLQQINTVELPVMVGLLLQGAPNG